MSQREILEDYPGPDCSRYTSLSGLRQWSVNIHPPATAGGTDKLGHYKLFVVVEALEDVGDVVDGFEAAAEAKLYHFIA
jgi:hypothetical protein